MNGRFVVVAVRHLDGDTEPIGYRVPDFDMDITVLHYDSHVDARLGAAGLRATGFTIAGIRDRLTGRKVTSTPLKGVSR